MLLRIYVSLMYTFCFFVLLYVLPAKVLNIDALGPQKSYCMLTMGYGTHNIIGT